jgi:hypothetical protein
LVTLPGQQRAGDRSLWLPIQGKASTVFTRETCAASGASLQYGGAAQDLTATTRLRLALDEQVEIPVWCSTLEHLIKMVSRSMVSIASNPIFSMNDRIQSDGFILFCRRLRSRSLFCILTVFHSDLIDDANVQKRNPLMTVLIFPSILQWHYPVSVHPTYVALSQSFTTLNILHSSWIWLFFNSLKVISEIFEVICQKSSRDWQARH